MLLRNIVSLTKKKLVLYTFMNAEYVMWKALDFFQCYFLILDVSAMQADDLADLILMIPSFERMSDLKHNIYNLINYCLNYKNNISHFESAHFNQHCFQLFMSIMIFNFQKNPNNIHYYHPPFINCETKEQSKLIKQ